MNIKINRILKIFMSLLIGICLFAFINVVKTSASDNDTDPTTYSEMALNTIGKNSSLSETNYENYILKHSDEDIVTSHEINIEILNYSTDMDNLIETEDSVITEEVGNITWYFNVEKTGLYNLEVDYFPVEGKTSSIERKIYIDNKLPFDEAARISFWRVWTNDGDIERKNGNDIRPSQVEAPSWIKHFVDDREKVYTDPYLFYLEEGEHTITFESIREPLQIRTMDFKAASHLKTYEEIKEEYKNNDLKEVDNSFIKIQAESAIRKSSPSLYPTSNKSSGYTEPSSPSKIRINTIGGESWRFTGDWIEWEVNVEKEGLYQLSFRANQSYKRGFASQRAIYINGKIPFEEAKAIGINYSSQFQMYTVGGKTPYLFHLKEGINTIRLEVVLGDMGEIIKESSILVADLNELYREILLVTSATPDPNRDYRLTKVIDNLEGKLVAEKQRLERIIEEVESITGTKSDQTSVLYSSLIQLENFINKPNDIHKSINEFNSNNSALGTWIYTIKEQPLQLDYLIISSSDEKLPKANGNFFERIWYEIKRYFASYTNDYNSFVSETGEYDKKIEVWVITGRDQSQIIRRLVDDTFTPNENIYVDIKLVPETVVLPATLSGEGPDIVLQLKEEVPINYALRNALVDLTQFDDYEEVSKRFDHSAIEPFEFNNGVYALPDSQIFQMMFYREDILNDLGLDVPKTWDDVFEMMPILSRNNLEFFIDVTTVGDAQAIPNTSFSTLLYQHGGEYYGNGGEYSDLGSDEAMEAFKFWTDLYTSYDLPLQANFYNRMRTGQIPIGIVNYSNYNYLSIFAPEIRGLWKMAPVPGIVDENGNINNTVASYSTGVSIFKHSKDVQSSWEFLKWWTSKDTQVSFGRELETVLGVAARHPSANSEALNELPWPAADIQQLNIQRENLRGVPQVPGGYMTARQVEYAFRQVINDGFNPNETLFEYKEKIDRELTLKRKEFRIK